MATSMEGTYIPLPKQELLQTSLTESIEEKLSHVQRHPTSESWPIPRPWGGGRETRKGKCEGSLFDHIKLYIPVLKMSRLAFGTYLDGIMDSPTLLRKKLLVHCDMAVGWFLWNRGLQILIPRGGTGRLFGLLQELQCGHIWIYHFVVESPSWDVLSNLQSSYNRQDIVNMNEVYWYPLQTTYVVLRSGRRL